MNEQLFTNAHGLRLITGFEGEPRLKARLCEGGAYELGYGVTFDLDGQPFTETSTCTPEYADALFRNALKLFEDGVRKLVTVPLNGNQFSALVAFAYNVGLDNLAGSTVLRRVNEGRMDDAAASFGMWVFATRGGRKQAYRGLLRRRYAEALLFMGYDWVVATSDTEATNPVSLQAIPPETLPGTDRVIYKTPFKDVLAVAQAYPLEAPELVLTTKADPVAVPAAGKAGQPVSDAQPQTPAAPAPTKPVAPPLSGSGATGPVAAPSAPQVAQKPLPVPVPRLPDPPIPIGQQTSAVDAARKSEEWSSNTKAMWQSRRFYGLVLIMAGRLWMLKTGSNAFLGAVSDPLVMEFVGGFCVMIAGELVQAWGRKKATKALH